MRPAISIIIICGVLLLQAVTLGCVRAEADGEAVTRTPAAEPDEEVPSDEPADGVPMRLTEAGAQRRSPATSPAASPSAASASTIDPRDTAFAGHRLATPPLYPSDFRIGSLRTEGLSAAEHDARLTARQMLLEIGSGMIPASFSFAPTGARRVVERVAQSDRSWSTVRVGRPTGVGAGEYSLPFVLQGEEGRWEGEVVLERADGEWYTLDIQASWLSREAVVFSVPGGRTPGSRW